MDWENLLWEQEGRVAVITFNRPKALNALNEATLDELEQAIGLAEKDNSIGALILTGSGEKSFVAGADIGELRALDSMMAGVEKCRRGQKLFLRLEELGKPVIAAINGFAFGGGLELALAKRAINTGLETDLASGCAMEAHYFGIIAGTEDAKEGTGAFLAKRPPRFQGR